MSVIGSSSTGVISVFEEFLLLFQRYSLVVHILYDCICETLTKLLRRFVQSKEMDSKHGLSLASINCKEVKLQLADEDIVVGDSTRKALKRTFTQCSRGIQCLEFILSLALQLATYRRSCHWATNY